MGISVPKFCLLRCSTKQQMASRLAPRSYTFYSTMFTLLMRHPCSLILRLFLQTGQISVPEKIAEDTMIIDLQNNDITEIKENDFIGLHKLYVRPPDMCWVGFTY